MELYICYVNNDKQTHNDMNKTDYYKLLSDYEIRKTGKSSIRVTTSTKGDLKKRCKKLGLI